MNNALSALFQPGRIAVIGLDGDDESSAHLTYRRLKDSGYHGELLAVGSADNSNAGVCSKVWPTLSDARQPVDLAIIHQPWSRIKDTIIDCGYAGVKTAIIVPNSHESVDPTEYQEPITSAAARSNIRLLGPSSSGFSRPHIGLNLHHNARLFAGKIELVSQSSSVLHAALDGLNRAGAGTSFAAATGSEWDLSVADFLIAAKTDPRTQVVGLCLTSLDAMPFLVNAISELASVKPLVVVMSQPRTKSQDRRDLLHTSMVQSGAVMASSLEEFCHLLAQLDPKPKLNVPSRHNIIRPSQSENFINKTEPGLYILDLSGSPAERVEELAASVAAWKQHCQQPVIAVLDPSETLDDTCQLLKHHNVVVCSDLSQADAVANLLTGRTMRTVRAGTLVPKSLLPVPTNSKETADTLTMASPLLQQLIENLGAKPAPGRWVTKSQIGTSLVRSLTWPATIIAIEPASGLNASYQKGNLIKSATALKREVGHLSPQVSKIYIQSQPADGLEIKVEICSDPDFGAVTTISVLGINPSHSPDYQFGLGILNQNTAEKLLSQAKVDVLLEQWPDQVATLKEQLIVLLQKAAATVVKSPQISKLSIGPLMVSPSGLTVLDAQLIIKQH